MAFSVACAARPGMQTHRGDRSHYWRELAGEGEHLSSGPGPLRYSGEQAWPPAPRLPSFGDLDRAVGRGMTDRPPLEASLDPGRSDVSRENQSKLARRVASAAEAALARSGVVAPVDVLTGLGWLPPTLVEDWRRGRVDHLERRAAVPADRLAIALEIFRGWAEEKGLTPSEAAYTAATRDRRPLRFTSGGDEHAERAYRTHWMSPDLSTARREQVVRRASRVPDLVVISPLGDWVCAGCAGTGDFLLMEDAGPLCLSCTDLDHLVFLPAGDVALTRRARKASGLAAVVVRFSRSRKRYERQGLLVEPAALEAAEQQCLGDEEARARRRDRDRQRREAADAAFEARVAAEIRRLFPGCPARRADAIASHTAERGSGRVGRSAAAQALDPDALTRALAASVRHTDTDYDVLLMSGVPRQDARDRVRPSVERILGGWRTGRRDAASGRPAPADPT